VLFIGSRSMEEIVMCKLVKELKELANKVIKMEHKELDNKMSKEDMIEFTNAVSTLQVHSCHIVKELTGLN